MWNVPILKFQLRRTRRKKSISHHMRMNGACSFGPDKVKPIPKQITVNPEIKYTPGLVRAIKWKRFCCCYCWNVNQLIYPHLAENRLGFFFVFKCLRVCKHISRIWIMLRFNDLKSNSFRFLFAHYALFSNAIRENSGSPDSPATILR